MVTSAGRTISIRNRKARTDSESELDFLRNRVESVPGRAAMVLAHLHRIDPRANMARFYCIDVAPTLFGDVAVLRSWGRIGTQGRTRVETCATAEGAESAAARTLGQKLRRGYVPAFKARGPGAVD